MSDTTTDPAADLEDEFDDDFDAEDLSMFDVDSDDYKNATSNTMIAPQDAVERTYGKRSSKTWDEILQIASTKYEKKEYNGAQPGDKAFMLTIVFNVDDESTHVTDEQEIVPSPNRGRKHTERLNFNLSALARDPSAGHGKMTEMSFQAFNSLIKALGMEDELKASNHNAARFIVENAEGLAGAKVSAAISQGEDKKGELRDEARRFSQWPEEDDE